MVVTLRTPPNAALLTALDHLFGAVSHEAGSKVVGITEHVSVPGEVDAVEFVRGLVIDAVPPGSTISEISAVPG